MGNLEEPVELIWVSLGGNRHTQRTPMWTRGEHANLLQKDINQPVGSNPEPSCLKVTVLPSNASKKLQILI